MGHPLLANGHSIIKAAILLGLALSSEVALGFPDNARHGYASCDSCHVSPTGGGLLNAYGRMTSAAFLSSSLGLEETTREDLARPFYGLPMPDWLAVGGDQRLLRLGVFPDSAPSVFRTIPMQADAELAVTVGAMTVAATWGVYGEEHKEGSRRHYALVRLNDNAHVRVGRFYAAYGLMGADHTTYQRQALGYDEGKETINLEMAFKGSWGDLFVTSVYGQDAIFAANHAKGYDTDTDGDSGVTVRAQAYLGKASIAGLSCLSMASYDAQRRACGMHALLTAKTWLWAQGSYDALITEKDYVSAASVSWEPAQGLVLSLGSEARKNRYRQNLTLQWFPIPHWEASYSGRREETANGVFYTAVGVLHHYL